MARSFRSHAATLAFGQVGRVLAQGAYFILLARLMGADQYGAAAAVLALAAAIQPFSSMGTLQLVLRNVSRDPSSAALQWANCRAMILVSGSVLAAALVAGATWVAPHQVSLGAVAMAAFSDLVLVRLTDGAGSLFVALGRSTSASIFPVAVQASRIAGLLLVVALFPLTVDTWAAAYVLSTLPPIGVAAVRASRLAGHSRPSFRAYVLDARVGLALTVGTASMTVNNDVDKAVLGRLSTLEATGLYSAAYRVVDMSCAPLRALLTAAAPEMWRAGDGGRLVDVLGVARRRLLLPVVAYCSIGAGAMAVTAPLLPTVLGPSFGGSVVLLRLLSVLLLIKGLQYLVGDSLACAGLHGVRTFAQLAIAFLNTVLCICLIPSWGLDGAIVATFFCDASLLALFLLTAFGAVRKQRHSMGNDPTSGVRSA